MAKLSVFFAFWCLLNVCRAQPLCPNLKEFEENNKDFLGNDYLKMKEQKEEDQFNFYDYIKLFSKYLSKGAFGKLYALSYNNSIVYKELEYANDKQKQQADREVNSSRHVCGHKKDEYNTITDCRSPAIAAFYGCFVYNNKIFLFMEKMSNDFSKFLMKFSFRNKPHFERMRIMLDMIDRFIELHAKGIIHSDVKPANIMMKYMGFKGIKIVDLGMADNEGAKLHGRTDGYLPPEMYRLFRRLNRLRPRVDIYALGVTFAELAGKFNTDLTYISKDTQNNNTDWKTKFKDEIHNNLNQIFYSEETLVAILPEIERALTFEEKDIFKSMEEFSDAFMLKMKTITDHEKFLTNFFKSLEKKNFYVDFDSYWKMKLGLEFGTLEQKKQIIKKIQNIKIMQSIKEQKEQQEREEQQKIILQTPKSIKLPHIQTQQTQTNNNNLNKVIAGTNNRFSRNYIPSDISKTSVSRFNNNFKLIPIINNNNNQINRIV